MPEVGYWPWPGLVCGALVFADKAAEDWVATGLIVGVVVLLAAPTTVNDQASLGLLVVPGCAAALVGAFRSVGLALLGGLALGVVEGVLAQTTVLGEFRNVVPFALILVVLTWSQRREVWDEAR